jgi:hypothetical protein
MWGIAVGGAVFAAGAWSYFRQSPLVLLLFLLPVPVTVVLTLALQRPIFPRFLFFAIGFVLLVTVRGAATVGAWAARLTAGRFAPPQLATIAVTLATLGAVGLSIRTLPYGYRYPKQDYERAVTFVERRMGQRDVAAAVLDPGSVPVVDYLGRPWHRVASGAELRGLMNGGAPVWVLYAFPSYIETLPDLWTILRNECVQAGEFEGTVAGGTINVSRCP